MMKPSIPKGTRDFSPQEMIRRDHIFTTIREVFKLFGFLPIETPAMENLETLTGKYGDEGDRLIFKILNSGDYFSKVPDELKNKPDSKTFTKFISEKALRYDLTVPFARYVVQHRNEITFPFKRYQIQPVWRADRPQKGRYREFFQCDADVIGSDSLYNEFELVQIFDKVFSKLGINVTIRINNRKLLSGLAEIMNAQDKIIDLTVAMDKMDKIGMDKVLEELVSKGFDSKAIEIFKPILTFDGTATEKLNYLQQHFSKSTTGQKGIAEMQELLQYINNSQLQSSEVELDLSLARGLDYYTGTIFEVVARNASIGSVCGGGRYDDLTGIFGLADLSGVGISFGADRIYDVMLEQNLFPNDITESTRLLLVNFGKKEEAECIAILEKVREVGINAELYPDDAKMKKQMSYANAKNIPYVLLVGSKEIESGVYTLKKMHTGEQCDATLQELIQILAK